MISSFSLFFFFFSWRTKNCSAKNTCHPCDLYCSVFYYYTYTCHLARIHHIAANRIEVVYYYNTYTISGLGSSRRGKSRFHWNITIYCMNTHRSTMNNSHIFAVVCRSKCEVSIVLYSPVLIWLVWSSSNEKKINTSGETCWSHEHRSKGIYSFSNEFSLKKKKNNSPLRCNYIMYLRFVLRSVLRIHNILFSFVRNLLIFFFFLFVIHTSKSTVHYEELFIHIFVILLMAL